jgi:hypothetical protein
MNDQDVSYGDIVLRITSRGTVFSRNCRLGLGDGMDGPITAQSTIQQARPYDCDAKHVEYSSSLRFGIYVPSK